MKQIFAFVAGIVMGVGLTLSGMINPAKVLNFLDLTGYWDPTLIFVMGGALATTFLGYKIILRRTNPLFDERFYIPTRNDLDGSLIFGAVLFGLGWGIAGFCPGPAIAALTSLQPEPFVFVVSMALGMFVTKTVSQSSLQIANSD